MAACQSCTRPDHRVSTWGPCRTPPGRAGHRSPSDRIPDSAMHHPHRASIHRRTRCGSMFCSQLGVAPCPCSDLPNCCACVSSRGCCSCDESEHVIDALSERMRSPAAQQRFEGCFGTRSLVVIVIGNNCRFVDAVTLLDTHASRLPASITKLIRGSLTSTISASSTDLIQRKLIPCRATARCRMFSEPLQSRTISNVESSAAMAVPAERTDRERLGSSERDHSLSINVDDTNLPAGGDCSAASVSPRR